MVSSNNNIHTKKRHMKLLRYWRPISLLCADYKIPTKLLAKRIKHILPEIIPEEQSYSIPNKKALITFS